METNFTDERMPRPLFKTRNSSLPIRPKTITPVLDHTYLIVQMLMLLMREVGRHAGQAEVGGGRRRALGPCLHKPQRRQPPVLLPPGDGREVLEVRAVGVLHAGGERGLVSGLVGCD